MMISKNQLKEVRQLELKKFRTANGLFVAEGPKVVGDLLAVMPARQVFATPEWNPPHPCDRLVRISQEELHKLSFLQHPQQVIALFPLPLSSDHEVDELCDTARRELIMALDGVQDPGNLGTIIRLCDWFGITRLVCSNDTADAFNPKVVQATMGSIARVRVTYTDLPALCERMGTQTPIYGTLLDGDNLYSTPLSTHGMIVMGNEGKGLSPSMRGKITHRLRIPSYPPSRDTAESLNVAMATGIVCAEFRRRNQ